MEFINDKDKLDQHFLIDSNVINKFIEVSSLSKEDIVLEIGAGKGVLTKLIAPKVKKLYVIEKDVRLKSYLDGIPNCEVIYDNSLEVVFPKVDKIITSLPYSIIEPFIYKIVKEDIKEVYMIMGKSYCDNVIGGKITNLSLLTNSFFDSVKYLDIAPSSFNPAPNTYSSLIKLIKKEEISNIDMLFQNMYKLDDKKIKNGLMESLIKVFNLNKRSAREMINSLDIPLDILEIKFSDIDNKSLNILYELISDVI